LEPAVEALKSSPTIDINLMEEAVKAAEAGVEYTKGIIAKKGRASYLGERSIGHQDHGATPATSCVRQFSKHQDADCYAGMGDAWS